jgi:hypothetical protein
LAFDVSLPFQAADHRVKHSSLQTDVEVIRPTRADLDAVGTNLLDGRHRAAVALQAYNNAVEHLS